MIPFFPPDLFEDERETLLETVRTVATAPEQRFILGSHTAHFEERLRDHLGAADVVACGSGTMALSIVLRAMEVGAGDEVIVPAFGCAPLASTVIEAGATPLFVDIDPWTMVLDPDLAEQAVTSRTTALMPAHMFSVMADMPRIREIAQRHGLHLVEDSAVAQGGSLLGHPAGRWGDAGVFSFVQVKTFGTAGEGGAVVTDTPELGRLARMLRNHGQDGRTRFTHHRIGYNSRFDEIQAAFLTHRLPTLDDRLQRRARIAAYYTERFAPLAERGIQPPPPDGDGRCYYVYSLLAEHRDALRDHLAANGVASHVYYPRPLPHHPAFAAFAPEGARWPNAERASARTLALPIFPHLTDAQVEHIADTVCTFAPAAHETTAGATP
ncbi:DegT/DnrJ/EryC1/StrS family aminotransferase [Salinactinospora qingdaonensis]|uniref:DegT/DnrJ/EryC1/StrS family aminotransferase n=1 Tax=Salinactinospora qingdaonensis TaxID=702744 RepID=A0ABP7GCW3_9ACTN